MPHTSEMEFLERFICYLVCTYFILHLLWCHRSLDADRMAPNFRTQIYFRIFATITILQIFLRKFNEHVIFYFAYAR